MAPRTEQTRLECETTISWNELDEHASLWTASITVRRDWESYGFPVLEHGGGWRALVPKDRITYRHVKRYARRNQDAPLSAFTEKTSKDC